MAHLTDGCVCTSRLYCVRSGLASDYQGNLKNHTSWRVLIDSRTLTCLREQRFDQRIFNIKSSIEQSFYITDLKSTRVAKMTLKWFDPIVVSNSQVPQGRTTQQWGPGYFEQEGIAESRQFYQTA